MTVMEADRKILIRYLYAKAEKSLAAAKREYTAGDFEFAINRIYYAAFYAVSAWLLENRLSYKKHAGVRAAFHQNIINAGLLDKKWSSFYDRIFEDRHEGDYVPLSDFDPEYVETQIRACQEFLEEMRSLIKTLAES